MSPENPECAEARMLLVFSDLLRDVRGHPVCFPPPLNFTKLSAILQTSEHDLAYPCTIKASVTKCPPCEQGSTTATKVPSQHSGEIVFSARCTLASVCQDVIYEPLHIVFLCGFLISLNARGFWTNKSEMNGKTCFEQLYFYIL